MKNLTALLSFLILFTAFTCEDEPLEGDFVIDEGPDTTLSCAEATQNTVTATTNFAGVSTEDENYSQLCLAYTNALEDQIAACGDDGTIQAIIDSLGDCGEEVEDVDIAGTWLLTAWQGEVPIDLNDDGIESINFLQEMQCYENETMVFNSDNSGVVISTSYADIYMELEIGTTDSYFFVVDCIEETENTNFEWTQDGNIVTVTDEYDEVYDFTLSGNQLSIVIAEGFYAANEDFTVTTIQDLTFVYAKQ